MNSNTPASNQVSRLFIELETAASPDIAIDRANAILKLEPSNPRAFEARGLAWQDKAKLDTSTPFQKQKWLKQARQDLERAKLTWERAFLPTINFPSCVTQRVNVAIEAAHAE
jgi:hypothetical protein